MRRGDRIVALAVAVAIAGLASGGCMVIYADPELPDVIVEWFVDDCRPGTGGVALSLIGVDSTSRVDVTVPCTDLTATFADVARERYHFEGSLQDENGEVFSRSGTDVDLRNGFDEKFGLYFGAFSNFRVAWEFANGATCESLGADSMYLRFTDEDMNPAFQSYAPCFETPYFGMMPFGTYTLRLSAGAGATTVATSAETEPFEISEFTDLGTITLSP